MVVAGFGGDGSSTPTSIEPPSTVAATTPPAASPTNGSGSGLIAYNLVTGAGGGLFVAREGGIDARQLATDVEGVIKRNDWSPDGTQLAFVVDDSGQLWIANLDGSPSQRLDACAGGQCDFPAWSPEGTKIAFTSYGSPSSAGPPSDSTIRVVDVATGSIDDVITMEWPRLADVPRWSPDGSQIVFGVDEFDDQGNEAGAAVAIIPVIGGQPRYLTDFADFAYAPDWNPVTDEIVFDQSVRDYSAGFDPETTPLEIYVIRSDGTGLRKLTNLPPGQRLISPRWTPDGTRIFAWSHATGAVGLDPQTGEVASLALGENVAAPHLQP